MEHALKCWTLRARGSYEFFSLTRIIGNWNLSGRWKWFVNWVSGLWVTCGTCSVIGKFCWKLCGRDALGPISFGLCTSNNHGSPPGDRCHCKHFHPSSHLLPRSTTTVQGGHYYSALRHLVRLWLVQCHPDGEWSWDLHPGCLSSRSCAPTTSSVLFGHARKTQERVVNVQHNLRISCFPGELFYYVVSLFLS